MPKSFFYSIPYVNELLSSPRIKPYLDRLQPGAVYATVRGVVDDISGEMFSAASEWRAPDISELIEKIVARLQDVVAEKSTVVLDGRSVLLSPFAEELGRETVEDMVWAIDSGRPIQESLVSSLLCRLTGAEDALVFGNVAQAKTALLKSLCSGRQAVIARRDLYDDGNGVRLESLFDMAGVAFKEVGASNGATFEDYRRVCSCETGLVYLAKGGYSQLDFTLDSLGMKQLRELAERFGFPLVYDVEIAPVLDLSAAFGDDIPTIGEYIKGEADLLVFSGGQLIGGPACGFVAGRKEWIGKIRQSGISSYFPVHRVDLAGSYRTLVLSQDRDSVVSTLPIMQRIFASEANLANRGGRLAVQLASCSFVDSAETIPGQTSLYPGGKKGCLPTSLLAITPKNRTVKDVAKMLEAAKPGIMVNEESSRLTIDLRMIPPRYDALLVEIFESYSE
ncbi:MAG: hypothetical protein Q4G59_08680 [Planctomycetia bacterium]|nr:hypothetical protein [Planctomycetia bacterium]